MKFNFDLPSGRRFLKGFYHRWVMTAILICDTDPMNKILFPHSMVAQWFQRRSLQMLIDTRQTNWTANGSLPIL